MTTISSGAAKGKTELLGTQSNKCLDIKGSSTANGTQLEIFTCNGGNNQAWKWTTATLPPTSGGGGGSGGSVNGQQLISQINGKLCMDDYQDSSTNNNKVAIWACSNTDKAMLWGQGSNGTITINGKCLDINKNGTTNGTKVDIFTCNNGKNQQWSLVSNGKGKMQLQSAESTSSKKICLDDPAFSTTNGTQLDIWACNGGNNQAWSWGQKITNGNTSNGSGSGNGNSTGSGGNGTGGGTTGNSLSYVYCSGGSAVGSGGPNPAGGFKTLSNVCNTANATAVGVGDQNFVYIKSGTNGTFYDCDSSVPAADKQIMNQFCSKYGTNACTKAGWGCVPAQTCSRNPAGCNRVTNLACPSVGQTTEVCVK